MQNTLKPFNLERALAGDPVVTKSGRQVEQITLFNASGHCIAGVVDGFLHKWQNDGKFIIDMQHQYDLFMAPIEKTGWMMISTSNIQGIMARTSCIYETEESAISACRVNGKLPDWHKVIQVTWYE